MAEKTKSFTNSFHSGRYGEFDNDTLRETMRNFLEEEREDHPSVWNVATILGIAMFVVAMISVLQLLGVPVGDNLSGLIHSLPVIGAVLVIVIGFGYLVGDRRRIKAFNKKKRNARKRRRYPFDEGEENFTKFKQKTGKKFNFDNDLDEDFSPENDKEFYSDHHKYDTASDFDPYAFQQSKRLYKSRTNKKIFGVCGGLADYFGISASIIRLLFVIFFFAGSGASLIAYFVLAAVLDKEPVDRTHRFDY